MVKKQKRFSNNRNQGTKIPPYTPGIPTPIIENPDNVGANNQNASVASATDHNNTNQKSRGEKIFFGFLNVLLQFAIVFLGAYLSIRLTNSNSDNLNRKLEKEYLKVLITELDADSKEIANVVFDNTQRKKEAEQLLEIVKSFDKEIKKGLDTLTFLDLNTELLGGNEVATANATFLDLKFSGNIQHIQDRSIRNRLFYYYEVIEMGNNTLTILDNNIKTYILPFFPFELPFSGTGTQGGTNESITIPATDLSKVHKNYKYMRAIDYRISMYEDIINLYSKILITNKTLKRQIEAYLEKTENE